MKFELISLTVLVLFQIEFVEPQKISKPCNARIMPAGLICVCNSSYCDTLEFDLPVQEGAVLIVSSSAGGARFQQAQAKFKNTDRFVVPDSTLVKPSLGKNDNINEAPENTSMNSTKIFKLPIEVKIEREKQYQNITGFGGSFTGAVSLNIASLQNDNLRNYLYTSFFSNEIGIGYNMMRIPIGGSDFDTEPWAYNETPENDIFLTNFTKLDERDLIKVSQIQTLQVVSNNFKIKLMASAWSAPKWMKTNNAWTGYGFLKQEFYQTWADYHIRFLDLMYNTSMPFWAITTGNEPLDGTVFSSFVKFMTMGWKPYDQGKWVAFNLGPTLQNHPRLKDTKIFASDDQRPTLNSWFHEMYKASPDVDKYISGIAFHWYLSILAGPWTLDFMKQKYPDKIMLSTETAAGWLTGLDINKPILGDWPRGEQYVFDIMDNLNHYTNGYIDWNIILNLEGGPNYSNFTLDATAVTNYFEWYKQPMFYVMGHFSRFLPPGSVRVYSTQSHELKNVAFLRPDGYVALILYNPSLHKVQINIHDKKNGIVNITVASRSLHTFLFK